MSLEVTPDEIKRAEEGMLTSDEFIHIIKRSLPLAWEAVHDLAHTATKGQAAAPLASLSEEAQGQLLRMVASTSMRNAVIENYAGSECVQHASIAALEIIDGALMLFIDTPEGRAAHTSAIAESEDRLAQSYAHVHTLAHTAAHQRTPEQGLLIAEPATLTEGERRSILQVMASSRLRGELAKTFSKDAEAVFVNCHMIAILQYPSEETRRRISSPIWQVLSQKPEARHC
jgi:hypothetical protein